MGRSSFSPQERNGHPHLIIKGQSSRLRDIISLALASAIPRLDFPVNTLSVSVSNSADRRYSIAVGVLVSESHDCCGDKK